MVDSKKLISLVEKYEKLIYDTADHIWAHRRRDTASGRLPPTWNSIFEELGYTLTKAGNIPDSTDLDTGKPEIPISTGFTGQFILFFSVKFTERTGDLV